MNNNDIVVPKKFGNISIGDIVIFSGGDFIIINNVNKKYTLMPLLSKQYSKYNIDECDIEKFVKNNLTLKESKNISDASKSSTKLCFSNHKFTLYKDIKYFTPSKIIDLFYYPFLGKVYDFFPAGSYSIEDALIHFPEKYDEILSYDSLMTPEESETLLLNKKVSNVNLINLE